jgi:hypothetical protein
MVFARRSQDNVRPHLPQQADDDLAVSVTVSKPSIGKAEVDATGETQYLSRFRGFLRPLLRCTSCCELPCSEIDDAGFPALRRRQGKRAAAAELRIVRVRRES